MFAMIWRWSALILAVSSLRHEQAAFEEETALNRIDDLGTCTCDCRSERDDRIMGGFEAQPHEFPWTVAILVQGEYALAGVLVTPLHVLTVAHGLRSHETEDFEIFVGGHSLTKRQGTMLRAASFTWNREFNASSDHGDTGIIQLERRVQASDTVRVACLPKSEVEDFDGHLGLVAGWGQDKFYGHVLDVLHSVTVPILSWQHCCQVMKYEPDEGDDTMYCAGYKEGLRDACPGDSGGPLMSLNKDAVLLVVGITSWGKKCGLPGYPQVYMRVASYLDWILAQIGEECLCTIG